MERADIWYCTDNDKGKDIFTALKNIGMNCVLIEENSFLLSNIIPGHINIFIIDIISIPIADIMAMIRKDERIHKYLKFIVLHKRQIRSASHLSTDLMNVEILSRPLLKRDFSLLIEKSIIVERYKEMLTLFSFEAGERIEAYANLIDINRKESFFDEKEKNIFSKIIHFEKHIIDEQKKLNQAIAKFTQLRQEELFDLRKRVNAEEMLADLRRKELMDAKHIIDVQNAVLEYSSKELMDANEIIHASEAVQELGRLESMRLHEELKLEKKKNADLQEKISVLEKKIQKLEG